MSVAFASHPRIASSMVCACTSLAAACAFAQSTAAGPGGSIGVTSDYVYRGVSQTWGKPALQADLHYQARNGWAAGVWGSTADLAETQGAAHEIDIYISRDWAIGQDWNVRLNLTHYMYPDDPRPLQYDYDELIASVGYQSRLFATVAWSPNASRYSNGVVVEDRTAISYEFAASQPLIGQLSASAGVGYYDLPSRLNADYWFWNAGLACLIGRTQLTLAYIDTDRNAKRAFGYQTAGSRWAGSLAWRF